MEFYGRRGVTRQVLNRRFVGSLARVSWLGTTFGPGFFSATDRVRVLETTDRVRVAEAELLGYDPFPSFKPFTGSSWCADQVDPRVHEQNSELLRELIAALGAMPGRLGGATTPVGAEAVGGSVAGELAEVRASVLRLLEQLYDLTGGRVRRRRS